MMKKSCFITSMLLIWIGALLIASACYATPQEGKMPITTSSDKAKDYYLQGRDLFEKLRTQESIQFFEKAITEDSNFALAYLNLSFVVPSIKAFFENFNKAKTLVDKVTEGERLWIWGIDAGNNGYPMKQIELYQQLVNAYPNDERVHNLLGNSYFGQQDWVNAVEEYNKAIQIDPDFTQPYNQMGYAYRFMGDYAEAEQAFQKYIELIPSDPNPYDSYAELLMKMGKFDASIESYRKALAVDSHFVASYIGIATNLNLKGNQPEARKELQKLYDIARNDGERRASLFAMSVSYVDEGNLDQALEEQNKAYALAEKINDAANMSGDLVLMGNILLEAGKPDDALAKYQKAMEIIAKSGLSKEIKDNSQRIYLYNAGRIDLKKQDYASAQTKAQEFLKQTEVINNPLQIRLAHELTGQIALEEKDYQKAITELQQANQQNPYNFYRLALAYQGKGDKEKAKEFCSKAVDFNGLDGLNYAFVRNKAVRLMGAM